MFPFVITWMVRAFVRGPAKSWIFTSAALSLFRFAKRRTGRQAVIDLSHVKPGDRILIEHLSVTHEEQLKQEKAARRSNKAALKRDKRLIRASKRGGSRSRQLV